MTASTDALQAWLALEHEAVWLFPVIGARLDGLAEQAAKAYSDHRDTRDRLVARLRSLDVEPVAGLLSYDVGSVRTVDGASRAARRVERAIAAACLSLVGSSQGDARASAIRALTRAAQAELAWRGRPHAFPGLP